MGYIVITKKKDVRIHTYISDTEKDSISLNETAHIIETKKKLVLVDTLFFKQDAQKLKQYILELKKPLDRIIISHSHPDHWFGLEFFKDVPAYSLRESAREMEDLGEKMIEIDTRFFKDLTTTEKNVPKHVIEEGTIKIDGLTYEFEKMFDAEATVQLIIRLPDLNILILQDLLFENTHLFLAVNKFDEWIEKLKYLKSLSEYDTILPGHGKPIGKKGYDNNIEYLKYAKEIFSDVSNGKDLKKKLIARYPNYKGSIGIDIANVILFKEAEIVKDIWEDKSEIAETKTQTDNMQTRF